MTPLKSWVKAHSGAKRLTLMVRRSLAPFASLGHLPRAVVAYGGLFRQLREYREAGGQARLLDLYPCLFDRTASTAIDTHYFHQAVWAARRIQASGTCEHIDIGSDVNFVGMLTAFTRVTFIDIRPLELDIENYRGLEGSITDLPMDDSSVASLSSLHVIEHIGLGRYGDPIDPNGPRKAASEIARVLAPGGRAYISTPIGQSRVQFNGQRVFAIDELLRLFSPLRLEEFSMVTARGVFVEGADPASANIGEAGAGLDCGLGLFSLVKGA